MATKCNTYSLIGFWVKNQKSYKVLFWKKNKGNLSKGSTLHNIILLILYFLDMIM